MKVVPTWKKFEKRCYPLGYRIKFQLPFNNIKWLSDYSRRWQVKGYRVPTDSKSHQLGVAGVDNSTALTRLRANIAHSCSQQDIVAIRLTSEWPGRVMSPAQTFTPLGVDPQYQSLSQFLKPTEVRC